jgi:hyperosmotically inducible protein
MTTNEETRRCSRIVAAFALCASVMWGPTLRAAYAAQGCTKPAEHAAKMDDRRTTEEIERRIADDESVAPLADRVRVSTEEGVVTLRGSVTSSEDRMVIASLAESAPGVRRVDDRLEVGGSWHEPPSASPAR